MRLDIKQLNKIVEVMRIEEESVYNKLNRKENIGVKAQFVSIKDGQVELRIEITVDGLKDSRGISAPFIQYYQFSLSDIANMPAEQIKARRTA